MMKATGVAGLAYATLLLGANESGAWQLSLYNSRFSLVGGIRVSAGDVADGTSKRPTSIHVCNEGMCRDEGAARLREALESGSAGDSGCIEWTTCLGTW